MGHRSLALGLRFVRHERWHWADLLGLDLRLLVGAKRRWRDRGMCDDGRGLSNGLGRESVCTHAVERAGLRVEDGLLSRLKLLAGNGGL